ncbi:hypothetical protein ACF07S_07475 [Streptomyces sp. NPDC016640]|uniref:hypothetical protein n=1 Tax=Streptomyces sp. NPDC016640 TaxID=3364969 RepID=UPI0036F7EDC8
MAGITVGAARARLGDLVRGAARGRGALGLAGRGQVAALLVSPRVRTGDGVIHILVSRLGRTP